MGISIPEAQPDSAIMAEMEDIRVEEMGAVVVDTVVVMEVGVVVGAAK
jgi:hypothetical protein